MRVLITGATGFVGGHLVQYLSQAAETTEIHGTTLSADQLTPGVQLHQVNLTDEEAVHTLLQSIQPDQIYHLAAQASPRQSCADPWNTLKNNIQAQLNIILACINLSIAPRILVISSAEIYQAGNQPIDEATPLNPTSPYGVSKIAQDMLALQYAQSNRLPIMRARPFNHIGPGQSEGFVAPDFATQIARIEAGMQEPVLEVGNLAAQRDFTDVRDVVRAYHLIVEQGQPADVYNVASGKAISIQNILDILLSYSTRDIEVRVDPARFLPIDVPIKQGNADRLRQAMGWQPTISLEQSLLDILNECRQRIQTT